MTRWIGFGITCVFLLFLAMKISEVGVSAVVQSLASANKFLLLIAMVAMMLSVFMHAYRWKLILKNEGNFSVFTVFESLYISYWFNAILPGRPGELVRTFHFSKKHGLPFTTILASLVLDRAMEIFLLTVMITFCLLAVWTHLPKYYVLFPIAILLGLITVLILLLVKSQLLEKILNLLPGVKLKKHLHTFLLETKESFKSVNTPASFFAYAFFTAGVWGFNITGYTLLIYASNLPAFFKNIHAGAGVSLSGVIAQIIPASASGAGLLNYAVVVALEQYAIARQLAYSPYAAQIISFSILVYVVMLLPDLIIGGFLYWRNRKLFTEFNFNKPEAQGK